MYLSLVTYFLGCVLNLNKDAVKWLQDGCSDVSLDTICMTLEKFARVWNVFGNGPTEMDDTTAKRFEKLARTLQSN
jgi:hypothetical protein